MKTFRIAPDALFDFEEASHHIAENSLEAAYRWEYEMVRVFDRLADFPYLGRVRPEYAAAPVRVTVNGDFIILYNPDLSPLEIIAILHGARDIQQILADREESETLPTEAYPENPDD